MLRVTIASLLALLAACGPRRPQEGSEEQAQVVLHGARLQSFKGEQLVLSGTAERVAYQRDVGEVKATNAVLHMPAKQGTASRPGTRAGGQTTVQAPLMEISLPNRSVTGSGGVVVRSPEGIDARSPRATYDGNAHRIQGSEGVTIKGPEYAVRADSFQLSLAEGTFTFEGSVQTVLGAAQ